ncbi:MAG: purine-nucleoside phosphorylase [Candidatus Enterosoma sp.]|nr:purine-nucleoside phosphorylase [Bacilli bacterium]MDD7607294.1 purine-nucleoside phosphorylase [bacterium]MDY3907717.1 purine-nucleoside phosphorylase [Candidatus Enterosoma sp.]MDY5649528.1 purine-nucleoside phosphorylase [Candidatus Enterosoma sp.]MDY5866159.1 purine-nucleoside phosphorylase [Candidatus Enterosoma sp.]
MPTPHNTAKKGEIAKTVLMPGDPLRAKFIAETFLDDIKLVNSVRNMLAYTGKYQGKEVTIMGSGMGIPSIGIYSYELYNFYDVDRIIRIGSAGSVCPDLKLFDIVIAQGASTNSNWIKQYNLPENSTYSAISSYEALSSAVESAKRHNFRFKVGQVLSGDNFYNDPQEVWSKWAAMGILCLEMESYGLFATAAQANKEALAILTISDSLLTHEETTAEERQTSFTNMMKVALDCIK